MSSILESIIQVFFLSKGLNILQKRSILNIRLLLSHIVGFVRSHDIFFILPSNMEHPSFRNEIASYENRMYLCIYTWNLREKNGNLQTDSSRATATKWLNNDFIENFPSSGVAKVSLMWFTNVTKFTAQNICSQRKLIQGISSMSILVFWNKTISS